MKKEELIHVPELTAIQVGGQTYDVVIDDRLTTEMNAFGATFFGENLIKLHPHQLGSQMANSIIHEAIHALHNEWNVMPIDDKEEQVTTTMANAVLLFLRDNPDFLVTVMGLLGKPIKFLTRKKRRNCMAYLTTGCPKPLRRVRRPPSVGFTRFADEIHAQSSV